MLPLAMFGTVEMESDRELERAGLLKLFVPLEIYAVRSRGPIVAAAGAVEIAIDDRKINFFFVGPIVENRCQL